MIWTNVNDFRFRLDGEPLNDVVAIAIPRTGDCIVHTADGETHLGVLEALYEPDQSKDSYHA